MSIQAQLKTLDLTPSEIKIYLYLLEQGISTPPQIAKGTGIARTNCYNVLKSLKDQGLIKEQEKGKRLAYLASDPEALLRKIEAKKEAVEALLPDLRALYTTQKNKPKIEFYDGFEQVKEIYWRVVTAEQLYAIGSTKRLVELDATFFTKWQKKMKQNGGILKDLISEPSKDVGLKETKQILRGYYDFRTMPSIYGEIPTDILIWDDHIALITLEEPIFGTVITNPDLAQTFKYLFDLMWRSRRGK